MPHSGLVGICLTVTALMMAACSSSAPGRMMPRLESGPSEDRPPWLRDLPQPLERYPAPEGWGGDHMAALQIRVAAG